MLLKNKKISKVNFKKIKGIKINKHIKQLKKLNLLLTSKKKQIIRNQINFLRGISLHRLENFISRSINKTYENFKKKQQINKLKKIKLKKRKEARRIIKEKRNKN